MIDYKSLNSLALIDMLADYTEKYTQLLNAAGTGQNDANCKDPQDCKEIIKQLIEEIRLREVNG